MDQFRSKDTPKPRTNPLAPTYIILDVRVSHLPLISSKNPRSKSYLVLWAYRVEHRGIAYSGQERQIVSVDRVVRFVEHGCLQEV